MARARERGGSARDRSRVSGAAGRTMVSPRPRLRLHVRLSLQALETSATAGCGARSAERPGAWKAGLCDASGREGGFLLSVAARHLWRPSRLYGRGLPFRLQRVAASFAAVSAGRGRQPLSCEHRTADHAAARDRGCCGRRYRCRAARQLCAGSAPAS